MATAGDEKVHHVSGVVGEKRPFQSENSTGIVSSDQCESCGTTGISISSDLEQKWKQMKLTTRFKIQHLATMENLPDEILLNIFVRLLAKQLAQMRSVSKSWNALLSHPSFVKSHLHRSIRNNNDQILLVFPIDYRKPFTQYSSQSSHLEPTNFIKHTPADLPKMVIGSVNGLVCLSERYTSEIHIWNPSLSAVSTIPLPDTVTHNLSCETFIRFGFDPKTDDYKLVKLSGVLNIVSVKWWLQAEVYSLRKRSWELITQPFPSHIRMIYDADYLCVDGHDGHLHWEINSNVKTEETIVAFDLGSEIFYEIPLPDSILDFDHSFHQLGILSRKLCEISWRRRGAWEVWVMEEYGVPESWVKRHEFSQFTIGLCIYGFTLRNELLVRDEDDRLVLYDPIANKAKLTRTEQSANKIVEFVDSLVWV